MSERSVLIVGPGESFTVELAEEFARHKYEVGLMGRNQERLEILQDCLADKRVPTRVFQADVTDPEAVANAFEACNDQLPPWQTVIHNVKQSPRGNILAVDTEEAAASLHANVVGLLNVSRFAIAGWDRTPDATLMVSGGGYKDVPDPDKLALSMSKGALHSLVIGARSVLKQHQVAIKEVVIDGYVRPEGPLYSKELAKFFLQKTLDSAPGFIYHFPPR